MWERLITPLAQVLSRLGNGGVSRRRGTFGQTGFHTGLSSRQTPHPFRQQDGASLDRAKDSPI